MPRLRSRGHARARAATAHRSRRTRTRRRPPPTMPPAARRRAAHEIDRRGTGVLESVHCRLGAVAVDAVARADRGLPRPAGGEGAPDLLDGSQLPARGCGKATRLEQIAREGLATGELGSDAQGRQEHGAAVRRRGRGSSPQALSPARTRGPGETEESAGSTRRPVSRGELLLRRRLGPEVGELGHAGDRRAPARDLAFQPLAARSHLLPAASPGSAPAACRLGARPPERATMPSRPSPRSASRQARHRRQDRSRGRRSSPRAGRAACCGQSGGRAARADRSRDRKAGR